MTQFVFQDFFLTTIAAATTTSQTTIQVADATNVPTIGSGQQWAIVIQSANTPSVRETVYVTSISSTTFTVVRAQEGTSGVAWSVGDQVFGTNTSGQMAGFGQLAADQTWSDTNTFSKPVSVASATASGDAAALSQVPPGGQCCLSLTSATEITLAPKNGSIVTSGGVPYSIGSSGLNAANTNVTVNGTSGQNLAASTAYYISYNGSSGILKFWAQASYSHAPDTTPGNIGVEVITNGGSPMTAETLVGWCYTNASAQFADSKMVRTILSWFNRRAKTIEGAGTDAATTTSLTPVLLNSAATIYFGTWGDEDVMLSLTGNMSNNTASDSSNSYIGVDGSEEGGGSAMQLSAPGTVTSNAISCATLGEGYHSASPYGYVSGGTGTFSNAIYGIVRG